MKVFENFKKEQCILTDEQESHIRDRHPDATDEMISSCLKSPSEVRLSSSSDIAHLYYFAKKENRLFCVVLKVCTDGNFIATAYTTNKMKKGEIIYKAED